MTPRGPSADREAGWEHFPHDADVGLQGFGATPARTLSRPSALTAVVTHAKVEPNLAVEVRCESPYLELACLCLDLFGGRSALPRHASGDQLRACQSGNSQSLRSTRFPPILSAVQSAPAVRRLSQYLQG
jgi:hypothetical protein